MAAGNMSLFGGSKLVDLRIPSGKPGREGSEALQRYIGTLGPGIVTLITLPELDWQAKKAAWVTAAVECRRRHRMQRTAPGAPAAVDRRTPGAPAAECARACAGIHRRPCRRQPARRHQEIQKLGPDPSSRRTLAGQVEAAVMNVARYDVSDLRDALKARDTVRAARTLEGLKGEDAAPPLVLWALATEARSAAARQDGALLHAAKIDRMIKGLAQGDIWDEFLQLALKITAPDPTQD
jgi:DNA polymerase-3 subunit delta